jgi:hypothetical protein
MGPGYELWAYAVEELKHASSDTLKALAVEEIMVIFEASRADT